MSTNYEIDKNDSRFTQNEADKKLALSENEKLYDGMIEQSDKYYQDQINASKEYAATQQKNQQAQTDFAIEQIEQEKAQAKKDYTKEQSGAYVDWQKQSNPYGASAEQMAAKGLAGSGYSESAQVSMYNTYQNRVATARESYNRAILNYNNSITEARLQNNSVLAEIAYQALQDQLKLSLEGFQYKNSLLLEKANKKTELENTYYNRYLAVLDQINKENALAEEVRQYNESLAFQKEQAKKDNEYKSAQLKLQRDQFDWQKAQAAVSSGVSAIKKAVSNGNSGSNKTSKNKISPKGTAREVAESNKINTAIKSYSNAMAYLKSKGIDSYNLMTKSEWSRRKSSYNATKIGGVEVSANSSYSDYLRTAIMHALS